MVEAYEAERAKMAGEVMPKLKGLYDEGLAGAAAVLSKQPTSGEAAYLQAFMLKQRITRSDVEQAKIALQGSAVASSAMYDLAKEKGVDDESGVPGYIAVSSACDRCFGEDYRRRFRLQLLVRLTSGGDAHEGARKRVHQLPSSCCGVRAEGIGTVRKPSGRLSAERKRHGGVIPRWQAPPCGIASVPADSNRASEDRLRGPLAGTVCENNENQ